MRKISRWIAGVLGVALVIAGGTIIFGNFFYPEKTEEIVYTAKTNIESTVEKTKENVTGEYPTIKLVNSGGMPELDLGWENGFTHLVAYDSVDNLPQTWAAHNGLGGAQIINWEEGQKVNLVGYGNDGVWVVVDTRDVDKFGLASQASGLQGELSLQTCHWGVPSVRFVGLVPLEVYEKGWPPPKPETKPKDKRKTSEEVELIVED